MPASKDLFIKDLKWYANKYPGGLYQHYKGKICVVIGGSIDTEDGHSNVLYRELKGLINGVDMEKTIWSRPKGIFFENVPYTSTQRFKPVTPEEAGELLFIEFHKSQKS